MLTPNTTWEQRFGFIREIANATTGQPFGRAPWASLSRAASCFPGINIDNADAGAFNSRRDHGRLPSRGNTLSIGPSTNFANAGIFQNQFEGSSKYNWVLGKHTLSFGGTFDYAQLNVKNRENNVAIFNFNDFADFLTGTLGSDRSSGAASGRRNESSFSLEASLVSTPRTISS